MTAQQRRDGPRDPLEDPVAARFHSGAHPQRAIPADVNEDEEAMLRRERASLKTAEFDRMGNPRAAAPGMRNAVPVDADRPRKGVLYTGPTAEEELAAAAGIPVKDAAGILEGPSKRASAARKTAHGEAKFTPRKDDEK